MNIVNLQRFIGLLSVATLVTVTACSSSDSEATPGGNGSTATIDAGAAAVTAKGCDGLQKQCDSCADGTLKQACFTTVVTFKNGGDAGQGGCQAALDAKTYDSTSEGLSRGPCAKPATSCDIFKETCSGCPGPSGSQEALCKKIAAQGDEMACTSAMAGPQFKDDCCKAERPETSEAFCKQTP